MFPCAPKHCDATGGSFELGDTLRIALAQPRDCTPVWRLIEDLRAHACAARASVAEAAPDVVLRLAQDVPHKEGYRLLVEPRQIRIEAATAAGLYYGVQTLRAHVRQHGRHLPAVVIEDHPDFARRGVYLDCSRGKVPTLQTLCALIEQCAQWKLNEVQLYVENVFTFARHPDIGRGYSPFTPQDMALLQTCAREHHVELVPSLASLGHFEKILMIPGYEDLGELPGYRGWPGGTTLNPLDLRSLALLTDLYAEYLPLFTARDFNACGDEPWELGRGRSKSAAATQGVGRLYLDFICKLRDLAAHHGKRLNLWGDIVLQHPEVIPDIPDDLIILNWEYEPQGGRMARTHEIVDAGHPVVCCPGTSGWQSFGSRLQTSFQNIYAFAHEARTHACEGLLTTDWGDNGHRNALGVSLPAIAYGAACAWNGTAVPAPNDDAFLQQYTRHVLGDPDGSLVPVIKTVGDERYGYWAYHALFERITDAQPVGEAFARGRAVIDNAPCSSDDLAELQAQATALAASFPALPQLQTDEQGVASLAVEEYRLANRLNLAATRRLQWARRYRAKHTVPTREWQAHQDELAELCSDFVRLWRQRNRPSRLCDNVDGFEALQAELQSLIQAP